MQEKKYCNKIEELFVDYNKNIFESVTIDLLYCLIKYVDKDNYVVKMHFANKPVLTKVKGKVKFKHYEIIDVLVNQNLLHTESYQIWFEFKEQYYFGNTIKGRRLWPRFVGQLGWSQSNRKALRRFKNNESVAEIITKQNRIVVKDIEYLKEIFIALNKTLR